LEPNSLLAAQWGIRCEQPLLLGSRARTGLLSREQHSKPESTAIHFNSIPVIKGGNAPTAYRIASVTAKICIALPRLTLLRGCCDLKGIEPQLGKNRNELSNKL
jgi:hypothetical protein